MSTNMIAKRGWKPVLRTAFCRSFQFQFLSAEISPWSNVKSRVCSPQIKREREKMSEGVYYGDELKQTRKGRPRVLFLSPPPSSVGSFPFLSCALPFIVFKNYYLD